jgi:hypothetical protein
MPLARKRTRILSFETRGVKPKCRPTVMPLLQLRIRNIASSRSIVHHADPNLPIDYFRTLDEQVNRSLNKERLLVCLLIQSSGHVVA